MLDLLSHPRVECIVGDQCEYGLYSQAPDGSFKLSKKPTRWASSSQHMLRRLGNRCKGDHEHQRLEGGRAANAAFYSRDLVLEILRGIRDTTDAEHGVQEEEERAEDHVNAIDAASNSGFGHLEHEHDFNREFRDRDLANAVAQKSSTFKFANGETTQVAWRFKDRYVDEYTSEALPAPQIHDAIVDELN